MRIDPTGMFDWGGTAISLIPVVGGIAMVRDALRGKTNGDGGDVKLSAGKRWAFGAIGVGTVVTDVLSLGADDEISGPTRAAIRGGAEHLAEGEAKSLAEHEVGATAAKAEGKAAKAGETEATKAGRQAHKDWNPGEGYQKEVKLPSGKRADAVNFETRDVKELKPDSG